MTKVNYIFPNPFRILKRIQTSLVGGKNALSLNLFETIFIKCTEKRNDIFAKLLFHY